MQYTGIIGNPLGHSLSPVFQQAAFDHMEIEVSYELLPTEPSALENLSLIHISEPTRPY